MLAMLPYTRLAPKAALYKRVSPPTSASDKFSPLKSEYGAVWCWVQHGGMRTLHLAVATSMGQLERSHLEAIPVCKSGVAVQCTACFTTRSTKL